MESIQLTDSGAPLGELANYSLRHSATPFNPTDSSGELPSFNAILTDIKGDAKRLNSKNVSLRDWTGYRYFGFEAGVNTKGRVTSVTRDPQSGLVNVDANTIFERLNTEQTVLPVTVQDSVDGDVTREAFNQMCLAAGVPEFSVEGNLKHYVSKWSQIGYIGDSKYKWRYFGPPTSYRSYVTTEGSLGGYAAPLDVNLAQGVTFGMRVDPNVDIQDYRVQCFLPHLQDTVNYTLRHNGNSWYFYERVGSSSTVTLHSFVMPLNVLNHSWFLVDIKAHSTDATKINIKSRIIERDYNTSQTTFTDFTVTSVTSTLRNRPQPFRMDLGWDPSIIAGKTYDAPETGFITESPVLQESYPEYQHFSTTYTSFSSQTADKAKLPKHFPGFTGNVWEKIREFCAIYDFDIEYNNDQIGFWPRESKRRGASDQWIPAPAITKSDLTEQVQEREPARSVEVKVYPRVKDSDYNSLMFKADSVYTLEKGETKIEVVQTGNSFQYLNQPVPVNGVPVPYTSAFGSYVITGNDGYIVDPQWWKDNGGSITVNSTGVSGEIEITMQAPTIDTVRAPYRVSEGVADRPALYIMGYGIALQEPKTIKILTGNPTASQDVGATLDNPFVMNDIAAYNVGARLANVYGSGEASVNFSLNRADYVIPADSNTRPTPISDSIYWGGSYYRISDETITPTGIQFSECRTHNTVGVLNGEFASTSTVGDWNNLHDGKTIADVNLAPLPYYES